ncbi:hypothetical protein Tco_1265581 [Tanacetum coccineum]
MKKMRTVAGDDAIIIGDDVRIVKRRRQDCKETASGLFKRLLQRIRRPSHEGYQNTIELPDGNNLVPLRFDTIRRMRLCLFLFSFRDMPALDLKRRASIGSSFLGGFLLPFPGQFVPTEGDFMARMNAVSVHHPESDAPPSKGIKSLSNLLSPKYQSQSSLREQNRNCSSPKCVHFVKTITIIKKEERIVEPNEAKDNDHIVIAEMKEKVGGDEP